MTQDVTTPVQIEAGRECNVCPPWVEMCAHFDGMILALASPAKVNACPWQFCATHTWQVLTTNYFSPCVLCEKRPKANGGDDLFESPVREDAVAFFHAAELRLLRGELS